MVATTKLRRTVGLLWVALALIVCGLYAQKRSAEVIADPLRAATVALRDARHLGVDRYAPDAFAAAQKLYGSLKEQNEAGDTDPKYLADGVSRVIKLLREARARAREVRKIVAEAEDALARVARLEAVVLPKAAVDAARGGLSEAIALAGRGFEDEARKRAGEVAAVLRRVTLEQIERQLLDRARKAIEQAAEAGGETAKAAARQLASVEAFVQRAEGERFEIDVVATEAAARLVLFDRLLYPPFFWNPPRTLRLGEFILEVERYESRRWDFDRGLIVGASGTAWTRFDCQGPWGLGPLLPELDLTLVERRLRVVNVVRNPAAEIAVDEARVLDPELLAGEWVDLRVPVQLTVDDPITATSLADATTLPVLNLGELLIRRQGRLKVRFEGLEIQPTILPDFAVVLEGSARYPTAPPMPGLLVLRIAGHRLHVGSLDLRPSGTTARGELELPDSIVNASVCEPARIPLGEFAITPACQFRKELPSDEFGPWVTELGIQIKGSGIVADFSRTWSWPGWTGPPQPPIWRGVVLERGESVPAPSGTVLANDGYLKAAYAFRQATVTGSGMSARFALTAPYRFTSVRPFGYEIRTPGGWLEMRASAISKGRFLNGEIIFPKLATTTEPGGPVVARYEALTVQSDRDLLGPIVPPKKMYWGELTGTSPTVRAYAAELHDENAWFYLGAAPRTAFWPFDTGGFLAPTLHPAGTQLEALGLEGATLMALEKFTVFTPDTNGGRPIELTPDSGPTWLNVAAAGVHGEIVIEAVASPQPLGLGDPASPHYVGPQSFVTTLLNSRQRRPPIAFQFSDSSVYDSDVHGTIELDEPARIPRLEFADMQFTSTAHNAGGKVDLSTPVKLDYWGLGLVQKPGMSSAGVVSVKTGQIILTAAGLSEPRHFGEPLYLSWGELLASGELGRLFCDYDSSGQSFDGFPYTTEAVALSPFDPNDKAKERAFLKTGGTAHFDFFGANYLNIEDFNNTAMTGAPFDGRRVEFASDTASGIRPTDTTISRDWSGAFGQLEFEIRYDDADQDGLVGDGEVGLEFIHDGPMASSIVMSSERSCFTVNETDRHDFTLGPVSHFGSMSRIAGCGCIQAGQLERLVLSAELERTGNVNVLLRSAAYGKLQYSLTPTVSELLVNGAFYISVVVGGDLEATGRARFTVDRRANFVEGDIEGMFGAASLLSGGLRAEGQLAWHLGSGVAGDDYQSLQGRLAVQVMARVGGSAEEGAFYVGVNAPKTEAWVLQDADSRFKLNMEPLPARLTGVYGYVRTTKSLNRWVLSGGVELYAGMGGFVLTPPQVRDLGAQLSGLELGLAPKLPFVVGNLGIHVWGKIIGGAVSAGAWGDFNIIAPYPFGFEGTLGLEGCVLWAFCGSVDVTCGLNSAEGFYLE